MQFQVKIRTRSGGIILCGVTAESREDAYRVLGYLPGAGRKLLPISIQPIPPRSER